MVRRNTWTAVEISLLHQLYPVGGAEACMAVMPNRSRASIMQRASIRGVRLREHRGGTPPKPEPRERADADHHRLRHEPLSDLDRVALREWGHITRTGQLRPIVKVELEKVA